MTTSGARLRRPETSQRATFLELFFDLAFVFALFQLSHELIQQLRWSGALQALVLLLTLWRVWIVTTWSTDRIDPEWWALQLLVVLTLLGTLVLAATLPEAFGKYGLTFAGVYVAIQYSRYIFILFALRGSELQRLAVRALLSSGVSAVLWIVGAFTHGTPRGVLWTVAIVIEYAAFLPRVPLPWTGQVRPWQPPVAAEHLAERYQQIFIVALGELILVSGLALSTRGVAPGRTAAFAVSVATTALLWRLYTYRGGEALSAAFKVLPAPSRLAYAAVYVHLTMVAGIVVIAVGDELVSGHPFGRTPPTWAMVILGGPVLFLAGRAGFEYTVLSRVSRERLIGALVLAVLTPVVLYVPALLAAAAAAAVLVGVAAADAFHLRRHPEEPLAPSVGQ
jgi:low temperature requirement protein LtrA